jgi:hypothetical protein
MSNRLIQETSPYLLQHAENPVDWYPWGQEALARARTENRLIFLSIGYAACHWCHVMAHESFEHQDTAAILNENFVSIKVDREQRPDLDSIYMQATTALTGSGGWPMSVFLTPDLRPFYAGTYFPPAPRHGLPSFQQVLRSVARAWSDNPAEVEGMAARVVQRIQPEQAGPGRGASAAPDLERAVQALITSHDRKHGGWGAAPRFPQPMVIEFLMRRAANPGISSPGALDVAVHALEAMSRGGMYDVVGGGFSRYSTDDRWLVPHFEKMLYDNAQLTLAYLHAWQLTRSPVFKRVAIETLDFVVREMTDAGGGFYSSLDADSEGTEGKFYVWTLTELSSALQPDDQFQLFAAAYGLTEEGNWDGKTVLQRAKDDASLALDFGTDSSDVARQLAACHAKLLAIRSHRVRPALDDKVLLGWNGLMLQAFAEASRFLDEPEKRLQYRDVATRNATFLLDKMCSGGQPRRTWRRGVLDRSVFLEDYASLVLGLLALYQCDFEDRWFHNARLLSDQMLQRFSDPAGGFFDTATDAEPMLFRPKDIQDNATPSGNALACEALVKLAAFTGDATYADRAQDALALVHAAAARYPTAFGRWLSAADLALAGPQQLAISYESAAGLLPLLEVVNAKYRPNLVVAASAVPPAAISPALLADRPILGGRATAYVCEQFQCKLPVNTPEQLAQLL